MSRGHGELQRRLLAALEAAGRPMATNELIAVAADLKPIVSWDGTITHCAPPSVARGVRKALHRLRKDGTLIYRYDSPNRLWMRPAQAARYVRQNRMEARPT